MLIGGSGWQVPNWRATQRRKLSSFCLVGVLVCQDRRVLMRPKGACFIGAETAGSGDVISPGRTTILDLMLPKDAGLAERSTLWAILLKIIASIGTRIGERHVPLTLFPIIGLTLCDLMITWLDISRAHSIFLRYVPLTIR